MCRKGKGRGGEGICYALKNCSYANSKRWRSSLILHMLSEVDRVTPEVQRVLISKNQPGLQRECGCHLIQYYTPRRGKIVPRNEM